MSLLHGDKTTISITCRYDHTNKGELTVREWFNVIKVQNKVDISLDRVSQDQQFRQTHLD